MLRALHHAQSEREWRMSDEHLEASGHDYYRSGHVDGVHCADSVHCHWRGESVEAWLAHRDEKNNAAKGKRHDV